MFFFIGFCGGLTPVHWVTGNVCTAVHMRQTTLTAALGLHVVNRATVNAASRTSSAAAGHQALVDLLQREEQLTFHAVLPFGHVLKCVSELLLRCAAQTPLTVDGARGLTFLASDPNSGRLIHVCLHRRDMLQFRLYGGGGGDDEAEAAAATASTIRYTLETGSIHAVFHRIGTATREPKNEVNVLLRFSVSLSLFFVVVVVIAWLTDIVVEVVNTVVVVDTTLLRGQQG